MKATAYLLAIAVVLIDQLSKAWALGGLADGRVHPLLPGLIQQRLVFNTGAAFSLLTGNVWLLGLVSAAVAVALVAWIHTGGPRPRLQIVGLGLLLGGAVGNGLDRWRLGSVIDFLEFVPISFPVFNGADVAINLAVAALVIDWLGQQRGRAG